MISKWMVRFHSACRSEKGATLVEYVMIAAIIGLGLVAILTPLRTALGNKIQDIVTAITGAGS